MVLLPDRFKMIFKGICLKLTSQSNLESYPAVYVQWLMEEKGKEKVGHRWSWKIKSCPLQEDNGKIEMETLPFVQ